MFYVSLVFVCISIIVLMVNSSQFYADVKTLKEKGFTAETYRQKIVLMSFMSLVIAAVILAVFKDMFDLYEKLFIISTVVATLFYGYSFVTTKQREVLFVIFTHPVNNTKVCHWFFYQQHADELIDELKSKKVKYQTVKTVVDKTIVEQKANELTC